MMLPAIQLLADVAAAHGVTLQALRAPGRKGGARMKQARQEAARRLRHERGLTLNQIGRFLGGRHHTTIMRMIDDCVRERCLRKTRAWFARNPRRRG